MRTITDIKFKFAILKFGRIFHAMVGPFDIWSLVHDKKVEDYIPSDLEKYEVIALQFTGFQDSEDKDIYEGDVLLYEGSNVIVEFDEGNYQISYINIEDDEYHGEWKNGDEYLLCTILPEMESKVIGNIYENKELISK